MGGGLLVLQRYSPDLRLRNLCAIFFASLSCFGASIIVFQLLAGAFFFFLIDSDVLPSAAGPHLPGVSAPPLTGFDRVAWFYDALAGLVFGPAQRNTQLAALAGLPAGAPHLLILGGGTGWVLAEVLRRRPDATILYLEASPRMLARARARLHPGQLAQVTFRHGTQAALAPTETFDAVLTFFVLDCIAAPDLPAALTQLHAALRPGGRWLLADFRPARRGWRRLLLEAMLLFFRLTTGLQARDLPDFAAALTERGLCGDVQGRFYGGATEAVVFQ
jgi:tRNA (cmo5U34)-methyltransferase